MKGDATAIKGRVVDYFDRDARHYHQSHYSGGRVYAPLEFRQAYIQELIELEHLPEGARILDVGCGPGELVARLLEKGYDAWGVDISQNMVDEAAEVIRASARPVEGRVSVGDVEGLAFEDGFFDVVVASGVIEYQKDDHLTLSEMNRVVRPGGCIILNVSNYSYSGILVYAYLWARRTTITRKLLGVLKGTVLKRGSLSEYPDRRTHSPASFDRELADHGFVKADQRYFHFGLLPAPLDTFLPAPLQRVGRSMEMLARRPVARWLGGGYIVKARKAS